jgi:FixJ family two-component response regulator
MVHEQHTVLIVEDDASLRQATERLFRAAGYATVAFASAEALLDARRGEPAACLVIDIFLPGLSGFELQAQLAAAGSDVPVIFISGHDEPHVREQAEQAGAFAYLPKPWVGATLLGMVARAVADRLSQGAE